MVAVAGVGLANPLTDPNLQVRHFSPNPSPRPGQQNLIDTRHTVVATLSIVINKKKSACMNGFIFYAGRTRKLDLRVPWDWLPVAVQHTAVTTPSVVEVLVLVVDFITVSFES